VFSLLRKLLCLISWTIWKFQRKKSHGLKWGNNMKRSILFTWSSHFQVLGLCYRTPSKELCFRVNYLDTGYFPGKLYPILYLSCLISVPYPRLKCLKTMYPPQWQYLSKMWVSPLLVTLIPMICSIVSQAYLHSMSVMHRDLTSKNCLVEPDKVNFEPFFLGLLIATAYSYLEPTVIEKQVWLSN